MIYRYLKIALVGAFGLGASTAHAETFVDKAWVRATVGSMGMSAGYAVLMNSSEATDRLVSVTSPQAAKIEIHKSTEADGIISMEPVDSVTVAPGNRLELKPGGYHLMIQQIKQPLKVGDVFPLVFKFEKQGPVNVDAKVAPLAASAAP